jgi:hypothetical protein
VYNIQEDNTDVEINLYMGINDKKGKSHEDFIFYLSFRSSIVSRRIH